jgi:tetratricopeptide (TPR) repeat protein
MPVSGPPVSAPPALDEPQPRPPFEPQVPYLPPAEDEIGAELAPAAGPDEFPVSSVPALGGPDDRFADFAYDEYDDDAPSEGAPSVKPDSAGEFESEAADAHAEAEPEPEVEEAPATPDPEQVLATYEWRFDPETLREVPEDPESLSQIRDSLTDKINSHTDNASRARLLSLRAVVSRILGDLHKALADAKLALAHAEATGELRRIAICQARLAHVLQWRGEYAEADRLFAEANSPELPDRLRGTMHQHAGKSAYDQGFYIEACNHFERALELRKVEDPELVASTELALDAVFRQVMLNGWGPYPRSREEILQIVKPPTPAMDESTQLWGFTDADGETVVEAKYADIQPFRDDVAWVRRPEFETWELIGLAGESLIPPTAGYLGVSSFAGGLAWVSRDGNGSWIAIDKSNTVTISTGFDDVRPFRRGLAAVRRGGRWGAVDGVGRVIVPFTYDLFATALSDGRYIDGFSDEGLAVVQLGGRKGVVDRSGRTLVEPSFSSVVIHPVAFLITDDAGRWGALDRRGRVLIDPSHPSRVAVTMEIDRLMADARPVL